MRNDQLHYVHMIRNSRQRLFCCGSPFFTQTVPPVRSAQPVPGKLIPVPVFLQCCSLGGRHSLGFRQSGRISPSRHKSHNLPKLR